MKAKYLHHQYKLVKVLVDITLIISNNATKFSCNPSIVRQNSFKSDLAIRRTSFQCVAGVRIDDNRTTATKKDRHQHNQHQSKQQNFAGPSPEEISDKSFLHKDDATRQEFLNILSTAVDRVKEIEDLRGSYFGLFKKFTDRTCSLLWPLLTTVLI